MEFLFFATVWILFCFFGVIVRITQSPKNKPFSVLSPERKAMELSVIAAVAAVAAHGMAVAVQWASR